MEEKLFSTCGVAEGDAAVPRSGPRKQSRALDACRQRWALSGREARCFRGIDTLSACGVAAEVGAFDRFDHPDRLTGFLGIVPSEHSSGAKRRQGAITKAGSGHARRLLVKASHHYRHPPTPEIPASRQR